MARPRAPLRPLAEIEREHIELVLARMKGNKTKAAKVLGIDRRTLTRHGYKRERTRP